MASISLDEQIALSKRIKADWEDGPVLLIEVLEALRNVNSARGFTMTPERKWIACCI
jgi:hypothetical protein